MTHSLWNDALMQRGYRRLLLDKSPMWLALNLPGDMADEWKIPPKFVEKLKENRACILTFGWLFLACLFAFCLFGLMDAVFNLRAFRTGYGSGASALYWLQIGLGILPALVGAMVFGSWWTDQRYFYSSYRELLRCIARELPQGGGELPDTPDRPWYLVGDFGDEFFRAPVRKRRESRRKYAKLVSLIYWSPLSVPLILMPFALLPWLRPLIHGFGDWWFRNFLYVLLVSGAVKFFYVLAEQRHDAKLSRMLEEAAAPPAEI